MHSEILRVRHRVSEAAGPGNLKFLSPPLPAPPPTCHPERCLLPPAAKHKHRCSSLRQNVKLRELSRREFTLNVAIIHEFKLNLGNGFIP